MKIFFDTSAFIALFITQEKYHKEVSDKYHEHRRRRAIFFTSYYILDELFTRLMYDFGKNITQKIVKLLTKSIEKEEISVLDVDGVIFKKSIDVFLKFSEHKISFTDATTFTLFKDLVLDEIFTLDSDFKKIGLKVSL